MSAIRNPKLIVDVGMSEGNDTDFYLKKGFRVVGIEADPAAFQELASRFAESIARNELVVLNCAAHSESDRSIEFVRAYSSQGHSHIFREENNRDGDIVTVSTIAWSDIISIAGIPYYCKIDIEGSEEDFLVSIANSRMLPEYISVECHGFAPIEGLYRAGYRKFRVLHQNSHDAFVAPDPSLEGNYLPDHRFVHASGYFGKELYGDRWLDFQEIAVAFDAIQRLREFGALPHIWFDCHAHVQPQ
jgi:FkbM family methyltransferase